MLFDVYIELKELITKYKYLPEGTIVNIGETESRKSSISIVLTMNNRTKEDICGNILWIYNCKIIYQIEAQTDSRKLKVFEFLENLYNYLHNYLEEVKNSEITCIRSLNAPKLNAKNINGLDIFSMEFIVYA